MKKKKREQSSNRWFAPVIATVALLFLTIAIVLSFFVIGTPTDTVFVTEPWQAPYEICSTQWVYPEEIRNDPELMEAVAAQNLPVDNIIVFTEHTMMDCRDDNGTSYYSYRAISIFVDGNETPLADNEEIRNMIHQILSSISTTEISQEWNGIDLINVIFSVDDASALRWEMNYIQALRAYEAGVTGNQLFELGRVR